MTGIFAARDDGYVDVPLLPGERVLRQQQAAYLKGGQSLVGGMLVVTDQRLLFRPIEVGMASKLLNDGIEFLPDGLAQLGKLAGKLIGYATDTVNGAAGAVPMATIVAVEPGVDAGAHPSSLVLTAEDGRRIEIGISASLFTPIWSKKSDRVRDEIVALIRGQLGG